MHLGTLKASMTNEYTKIMRNPKRWHHLCQTSYERKERAEAKPMSALWSPFDSKVCIV